MGVPLRLGDVASPENMLLVSSTGWQEPSGSALVSSSPPVAKLSRSEVVEGPFASLGGAIQGGGFGPDDGVVGDQGARVLVAAEDHRVGGAAHDDVVRD